MVRTSASPSSPSVTQNPAANSKSLPGVRIVVATSSPSTRIDIGSSTINSSGTRALSAPTIRRVNTRAVLPRLTVDLRSGTLRPCPSVNTFRTENADRRASSGRDPNG